MTLTDIQKKVETLDHHEQKRLMGFLMSLEIKRDQGYRDEISKKLDNNTPGHWISLEEAEKRLGIKPSDGN